MNLKLRFCSKSPDFEKIRVILRNFVPNRPNINVKYTQDHE